MFEDRKKKEQLKRMLVASTIVLALFFITLFLYGIIAIRPHNIEKASKLGQYYEFTSDNLPSDSNIIHKGTAKGVVDTEDPPQDLDNAPKKASEIIRPRIAIFVSNLGLNALSTELALSLPHEVTFGFLPYTTTLRGYYNKAHEDGHEIFIYLPFETKNYPDDLPGQMPLLLAGDDGENIHRMHNLLHPFDGYAGVYGAPNEVFTKNVGKIGAILGELAGKKLKLLTSNNSDATGEMAEIRISSTLIIDAEPNIPAIKRQLDALVEIAKSGKVAIGYCGSYPVTIYTLKAWLPKLHDMGIEIVPISSIMKPEMATDGVEK